MTYRTLLIILALSASTFAGCSKKSAPSPLTSSASMIIEPGVSIGPVHSGMTMQQVIAELGKPDTEQAGALVYRNLGLAVGPDMGGVGLSVLCGVGGNAQFTKSFGGHTKEGIGIGASRDDIVKTYGQPSTASAGAMRYDSLGLGFLLKEGKVVMIAISLKP
jgi:hypothetical protein